MHATSMTLTKKYHLTDQGLRAMHEQLADLRQRRQQILQENVDISSQSTFLSTVEDSSFAQNHMHAIELDGRIAELEHVIRTAEILDTPRTHDTVQLGSVVTVEVAGKECTYHIVSPLEADPLEGRISDESPFGLSLIGKKAGEDVAVQGPRKEATVARILHIQ
jgi:transcription elongation factor GreA